MSDGYRQSARRAPSTRTARHGRANQGRWWWLPACLLLSMLFAGRAMWHVGRSEAPTASASAARPDAPNARNIEAIRVGQRVVTANNGERQESKTAVDPATWRLLRLHAEDRWADGTLDTIEVETLQPPEWIKSHKAQVGALVPLPLDLVEMGMSADLRATVVANEPCPAIASGPGRVVLTTINHLNAGVLELTVADERGHSETIRPTTWHKFYSESHGQWVSAIDLRTGEQLRGVASMLTVKAVDGFPGAHRVYNMTVEGEHVYRVSMLGVLVHNVECTNLKYHYTSAEESSFQRGLWSQSSVTDNPHLTAQQAIEQLGLKQLPDKVIPIIDNGQFVPNTPPIVKPHFLGPGGGTDFINPDLVPPDLILPARPVL
jgi:hypothetical protein